MIGLCYRTKGDPVPLWLSVDAADTLDRRSCYLLHGTIDPSEGNIREGGRVLREDAKPVLTRGPNNEVTGQLFQVFPLSDALTYLQASNEKS